MGNKKKVHNQPKIIGFLSKGNKENTVVVNTKTNNTRRQFFNKCVSNQNQCKKQQCLAEKNRLMEAIKRQKEMREKVKEAIELCGDILTTKDEKIHALNAKLSIQTKQLATDELYNKFQEKFTGEQLAELRSMDGESSSDAKFIRLCLQFLYQDQRIDNLSVTGRSRAKEKKEAMCPQTLQLLADIFNERLVALTLMNDERTLRRKRLNILINTAIQNSSNSGQNELKELNKKINCTQQEN